MGSMFLASIPKENPREGNKNQPESPQPSSLQKRSMFTQIKIKKTINKTNDDGIKMINDYIVLETIGYGIFGKVKKVTRTEGNVKKLYAMKIFSKSLM